MEALTLDASEPIHILGAIATVKLLFDFELNSQKVTMCFVTSFF